MTPVHFQVTHSQAVTSEFQAVMELARTAGRLPLAVRAGRYLWDELGYDPMEFGESRDYLPTLNLHLRVGFARPLYVEFAVNPEQRIVYLRKFRLVR